jgi:hypothetical protein
MPTKTLVLPEIRTRTSKSRKASPLPALEALPLEDQRFALLLAEALGPVADGADLSEADVRSLLARLVEAGLLQEQRAPEARTRLARTLGPSLADLDPVPRATVEQARRLAGLKASLLRTGAFTTAALADARGIRANTARQWISRLRRSNRVFTVTQDGEALVPAFLLDAALEPRAEATEAIAVLREAGEDGWALWAWFASPSAWLDGDVPAEILSDESERVVEAARHRAASAE